MKSFVLLWINGRHFVLFLFSFIWCCFVKTWKSRSWCWRILLSAGRVSWKRSCQSRGPTIASFLTKMDRLILSTSVRSSIKAFLWSLFLSCHRGAWVLSCLNTGPWTVGSLRAGFWSSDVFLRAGCWGSVAVSSRIDNEAFLSSGLEPGMFSPDSGLGQAALGLEVDKLYRGCLPCSHADRTMHLWEANPVVLLLGSSGRRKLPPCILHTWISVWGMTSLVWLHSLAHLVQLSYRVCRCAACDYMLLSNWLGLLSLLHLCLCPSFQGYSGPSWLCNVLLSNPFYHPFGLGLGVAPGMARSSSNCLLIQAVIPIPLRLSSVSTTGTFFNGRWYSFLHISSHVWDSTASRRIAVIGVANSGRNSWRMELGMSPGTESFFLAEYNPKILSVCLSLFRSVCHVRFIVILLPCFFLRTKMTLCRLPLLVHQNLRSPHCST